MGVHSTCISGGDTSCETVAAVSGAAPVAFARPAASASGTTNAPPMVRQSRAAKSAYEVGGTSTTAATALPYSLANAASLRMEPPMLNAVVAANLAAAAPLWDSLSPRRSMHTSLTFLARYVPP